MNLYFECNSGISGDMSVGALLNLGASQEKLEKALASMKLENEFQYKISKQMVNAISATDFDVILPEHHHHGHHPEEHHHEHRNLEDVNKIIDKAEISENAKNLAKKIFRIVAEAESKVHSKDISEIHFHEIGAIDSIVDIVSFSVLSVCLAPFKTLSKLRTNCVACERNTASDFSFSRTCFLSAAAIILASHFENIVLSPL